MKKNYETIADDNGIELIVGYEYDLTPAMEDEPGCYVEEMVYTELTSVEIVIAGVGIDILHLLSDKQKSKIIGQLTYEEF